MVGFPVASETSPPASSVATPGSGGLDLAATSSGPPDSGVPDPSAVPDPFDDADALEELGDAIATLAAHIHAATHRMLALIADFDRRRGWELGGHRSCAHWLAVRTGMDLGAAREKVRTARVLVGLPGTGASMARGELSFSAVRALTRVATPQNESDLLKLARGCTTAEIERLVRAHKRGSREEDAELERVRHESRRLSVFPGDDGMYVVKGRLDPEVGALLMRAIEAASDALYREEHVPVGDGEHRRPESETRREAARRRADAVGLLAERALAAGLGEGAPISGTRAERYQVILHGEVETLASGVNANEVEALASRRNDTEVEARGAARGGGLSELEDGTHVSAETFRRIACDVAVVRIEHAGGDSGGTSKPAHLHDRSILDAPILGVGRRTRTIPSALRRALDAPDHGCRFPGCNLRFTDAHHVEHWADGGETSLSNCLLLCRHHHRLVHEGGWRVSWWGEGRPVFFDPRGGEHYDGRWQPPGPAEASISEAPRKETSGKEASVSEVSGREGSVKDPVERLMEQNRALGASPDGWTASARWERHRDVPDHLYLRALEALG